jgi:hypothetical protein
MIDCRLTEDEKKSTPYGVNFLSTDKMMSQCCNKFLLVPFYLVKLLCPFTKNALCNKTVIKSANNFTNL